jgi:hypothetical protein
MESSKNNNIENRVEHKQAHIGRRDFVKSVATAAAIAAAVPLEPLLGSTGSLAHADVTGQNGSDHEAMDGESRANQSFQIRVQAAKLERGVPNPSHPNNGDEARFDNRIGNFTKTLPHNEFGEVDQAAYKTLLVAVDSERQSDFEKVRLGGNLLLGNPLAGVAFDLEGADSHKLFETPAFTVDSATRAGEMVELYWMALARDIPFTRYGQEPITSAAIDDLNRLSDFRGPKTKGKVTAQTLFRGSLAGENVGPLISQFFVMPAPFGALAVNDANGNPAQQYNTYLPGVDFMTDAQSFLNVQSGIGAIPGLPFPLQYGFPTILGPRYLHVGRDLAAFVHVDELYQAYFMATLNLLDQMRIPFNPGNPYNNSKTQFGFGTFGNPHAVALLGEVSTRALKAQWFQKWFVHRTLRPEAFGGLVHFKVKNHRDYPLNSEVLNSSALPAIERKINGNLFLPMAFKEGCPPFPALGSGHSTVAGACVTFIKAFFDENTPILNPVIPSDDGTTLLPYTGPGADQLTVLTEAHKIASNVGIGRLHAGVHWRSDHTEALKLGESIAISILGDQRATYREDFGGFTFTKFDGSKITV